MSAIDRLAKEIISIRRKVDAMASPQLALSSVPLEDGTEVSISESVKAALDAFDKADVAILAANGKNSITYSFDAPSGAPELDGDVWFQRSEDGLSVIAQWTAIGGAWTSVTLSHEVISSIDAAVITVGKMRAERIDTGVLASQITVTGALVAGDPDGKRVAMTADGIAQFAEDGSTRVVIPTDPDSPAVFEGDLVASSLTIQDRFALRGETNEIAKGSSLALSSGTSAPTSPPSLQVMYEKYDGNITEYLFNTRGFHHDADSGNRWLMSTFFGQSRIVSPSGDYAFPVVTTANGKDVSTWDVQTSTVVSTATGKRVVSVGWKNAAGADGVHGIQSFDASGLVPDGSVAAGWKAGLYGALTSSYWFAHRVGRCISPAATPAAYESHVAHAEVDSQSGATTPIKLRRFSVDDSAIAQVGSTVLAARPWADTEGLIGVAYGSSARMGFPGADQDIWLVFSAVKAYAFTATGSRLTDFDFPLNGSPLDVDVCGSTDAGVNGYVGFRSAPGYQAEEGQPRWVTKYTDIHWITGTPGKWWASATWFDPDAGGGTHETAQGPRSAINMVKRASLLVTVPPYPSRPFPETTDDVLASKVYLGRGATDPGRPVMEYAATTTAPARGLLVSEFAFPAGDAVTPPPAASNFPLTSPARITSGDGTGWTLSGDGTVDLQGSTFAPDGVVLSSTDGSVDIVSPLYISGDAYLLNNRSLIIGDFADPNAGYIFYRKLASDGVNTREFFEGLWGDDGAIVLRGAGGSEVARYQVENGRHHFFQKIAADGGIDSALMRAQEFRWTDAGAYAYASSSPTTMGAYGGGGTFVAPPSGQVRVDFGALVKSSAVNVYSTVDFEIRSGSTIGAGAVVRATALNDSALCYSASYTEVKQHTIVTGLTPGATYNIRQMVASGGGTATFIRGRVIVTPNP